MYPKGKYFCKRLNIYVVNTHACDLIVKQRLLYPYDKGYAQTDHWNLFDFSVQWTAELQTQFALFPSNKRLRNTLLPLTLPSTPSLCALSLQMQNRLLQTNFTVAPKQCTQITNTFFTRLNIYVVNTHASGLFRKQPSLFPYE